MLLGIVAAWPQSLEDQARRVLADNCLSCHGPVQMSGLRLDSRDSILHGGNRGAAVIPGNSAASLIYQAVARQGKLQMPPGPKALSEDQVRIIAKWIDAGLSFTDTPAASQPSWWSFAK